MVKNIFLWSLIVWVPALAPSAYAGKAELTTYYPAPYGEYSELQASQKLKVPVKNVVAGTSPTVTGEVWVQDDALAVAT